MAVEPGIPPAVAKRIAAAVQSSRSEGTRKTYAAAWRRFTNLCESNGHVMLPAHPSLLPPTSSTPPTSAPKQGERAYAVATFGTWTPRSTTITELPANFRRQRMNSSLTLSGIRREYARSGDRPRTPRDPLLVEDIKLL